MRPARLCPTSDVSTIAGRGGSALGPSSPMRQRTAPRVEYEIGEVSAPAPTASASMPYGTDFLSECWNDKPNRADLAQDVEVAVRGARDGQGCRPRPRAAHISGTLTNRAGAPVSGINVWVQGEGSVPCCGAAAVGDIGRRRYVRCRCTSCRDLPGVFPDLRHQLPQRVLGRQGHRRPGEGRHPGGWRAGAQHRCGARQGLTCLRQGDRHGWLFHSATPASPSFL